MKNQYRAAVILTTCLLMLSIIIFPVSAWNYVSSGDYWNNTIDGNEIVKVNATGFHLVSLPAGKIVEYLVVGSGGNGGSYYGSGGGAGGVRNGTFTANGTETVFVGDIAPLVSSHKSSNGQPSNITNSAAHPSIEADAGGAGGVAQVDETNGNNGGSGGGGAVDGVGGTGLPGQGKNGGAGYATINYGNGGGGGNSSVGQDGTANLGGNGGTGFSSSITGESISYACGGGGSVRITTTPASGGCSSAGNGGVLGTNPTSAVNETGSGGGGAQVDNLAGLGGTGIVIFKYSKASITANFTASNTSGFVPLLVHFTDTSDTNYAIIDSWSWDFGDGGTSTIQNPDHTYEVAGTYPVNLTIVNTSRSLVSTKIQNIEVFFLGVDFSANTTVGYPNDYFQFTSATSIPADTWDWSFGDGGVSNLQNPVHQYTSVGLYDVSLNVTNSTMFNSTTKLNYINISALPLPSNLLISANKTYSTDSTFAVLFTTSSATQRLLYRNLSFGDGGWYNTTIESDNSTAHTYTTVGNYAVALYETNAVGTTLNNSADFIVLTNPTLSMHPPDIGISRGLTGLMTLQVSNLSHVDGGATNITFNQTAVNIVSIIGNSTSSQNFTVTSAFDNNAGVASIAVSCIDVSSTSPNVDIVDIVWRANVTRTNDTAPVNFNSTAFTSFVKSNSSYNGFRYPNITYLNSGEITLTNLTWTRTLYFKNAYNLNLISGIQVRLSYIGIVNGSATTNTGMYVLSSTYGTTSVTAGADGYYNVTQDVLFLGDGTDTFLMTPLSGAPGQTTWYIPQQVRIYAVNSMGAPISGVYVTCRPLNFTAPETWTQILIGIQPSVNISGTTLDGWTGSDGSWVAPMLSSFQYEFHLVNSSQGINHTVRFNPLDTSYRIYVNTVSLPNNTLLQVTQSSLPFYKLNNSGYYNLSMIYQDALGYTTHLQFNVKDYTHGNTLVYTKNWTSPGTGVIIDNYTAYVPLGQEYTWQYNATKV